MQELHWILDLNSPKVPNYYRVGRLEYDVWVWANDIEAAETLMAAEATDVLFDAALEGFQRGLRYALSNPRAAAEVAGGSHSSSLATFSQARRTPRIQTSARRSMVGRGYDVVDDEGPVGRIMFAAANCTGGPEWRWFWPITCKLPRTGCQELVQTGQKGASDKPPMTQPRHRKANDQSQAHLDPV